ncbi:MAG: SUMF1/EgtB/PvdO family nonheme iron enzyme [Taibaiella sp.]|nr:SUMF1/EgtB/PvdO family nonheme iron enzyme [Taibaiella sp.]
MYKKSTHFALSLLVTASSLSMFCSAQQVKSRIRPVIPYEKAKLVAPPGMVYVPGGTTIIKYSQQASDSNCVKKVSLSSYFMDKTEVTNQQYRQFVEWVVDSIAITNYLKDDEKYFKDQKVVDSSGNSTNVVRRINWSKVNHKEIFDKPEMRAKVHAMLDERGKIKKDSIIFAFSYMRANGTNKKIKIGTFVTEPVKVFPDEEIWATDLPNAQTDILVENYFNTAPYDDYPVVGVTWKQARAYTSWRSITQDGYSNVADYMKSYHLAYSLPSEAQWVYAAQQDMKAYNKMLSDGGALDQIAEPKAGKGTPELTKKKKSKKSKNAPAKDSVAAVIVATPSPTPAGSDDANNGWLSSTASTVDNSATLKEDSLQNFDLGKDDKNFIPSDKRGLTANFKQDEGEYTGDGSPFTVPVMSYTPNDFGIYNMVGNVAEWTMDAYSPSTFAFVADVNPVLLYDADSTESDPMRRKVVRGGSFLSNAKALSPYSRDFEMDNMVHCYIGFRCVMGAPEILNELTATRRKTQSKKK